MPYCRRRCRVRAVLCLTPVMWLTPALSSAQGRPAPLHGVETISVGASIVGPDNALPHGLTEARLQTIAELKLRSWSLHVVSRDEARKKSAITPHVELEVTILETRSLQKLAGYAFFTRLAVTEPGTSLRNAASATTELWSHSFLHVSEPKTVVADIERSAAELLDQLVNEWLTARR